MRVLLTLLLLPGLSGCALALHSEAVVEGQEISSTALQQLRAGMTMDDVVVLLGPPERRLEAALHYREVFQYRACSMYFGRIPLEPRPRRRTKLDLYFEGGGLVRGVLRTREPGAEWVSRALLESEQAAM